MTDQEKITKLLHAVRLVNEAFEFSFAEYTGGDLTELNPESRWGELAAELSYTLAQFPENYGHPTVDDLAKQFSGLLLKEIGVENLRKVIELNAIINDDDICSSNDFCDANQVMLNAMQALGLEPDDRNTLIDDAWTMAKAHRFYLDE